MKKIIIKSALTTLGVVVGCAVFVFAVLSLGFPGTLCGWCEQLGNYGFAVKYASLYYSYTGDVVDLARCADDSILAENDGYIIEYCTQLVDDEGFAQYCTVRDKEINDGISGDENFGGITFSYRHYIYGAVSAAEYRAGESDLAIGYAISSLNAGFDRTSFSAQTYSEKIEGFPVNNALGSLSLRVIENKDKTTGGKILKVLEGVSPDGDDEGMYLATLMVALGGL